MYYYLRTLKIYYFLCMLTTINVDAMPTFTRFNWKIGMLINRSCKFTKSYSLNTSIKFKSMLYFS